MGGFFVFIAKGISVLLMSLIVLTIAGAFLFDLFSRKAPAIDRKITNHISGIGS